MDLLRFIAGRFSQLSSSSFRSTDPDPKDARHRLGSEGERRTIGFLKKQGYRILYRNFRAQHGGEVDIVCRDCRVNVLVFVEVKTRSSTEFGQPAEAVDQAKQRLISRGAMEWLRLLGSPDIYFRFDIVEVIRDGKETHFNLIKDAFPLAAPYRYG